MSAPARRTKRTAAHAELAARARERASRAEISARLCDLESQLDSVVRVIGDVVQAINSIDVDALVEEMSHSETNFTLQFLYEYNDLVGKPQTLAYSVPHASLDWTLATARRKLYEQTTIVELAQNFRIRARPHHVAMRDDSRTLRSYEVCTTDVILFTSDE